MDWDEFYLGLAESVAKKSRDPSTKVGCVIVRPDKTVASLGFNGFPRGMDDSHERYADRVEKYDRMIHAEENAILSAREPVSGYTAYTTLCPCTHCACVLIQAGIGRVVYPPTPEALWDRWKASFVKSVSFLREVDIEVNCVG